MTSYRTSHDLARILHQSDDTARRVLREVWPGREEATDWRLDESAWRSVLLHLARGKNRYGGRRRRKVAVMHDLSVF